MKKLFAVALLLCMLCTCAFAESVPTLNWSDISEETQAAGQFTQIALADDLALLCWIPSNMEAVDVSATGAEPAPVEAAPPDDAPIDLSTADIGIVDIPDILPVATPVAAPVEVPASVDLPEPESVAAPEPVAEPAPEPADLPEPEPIAAPEPVAAPEPEPTPVAAPALKGKSLVDLAAEKLAWKTDFPGIRVKNIRSAISLIDRAQFIGKLFSEDFALYDKTISELNETGTLDEAVQYVTGHFPDWDLKSDLVYSFMMAIRKKLG